MIHLVTSKTVDCTSCLKPVKVRKLKSIGATKDFPDGAYEGRCSHCGAVFEYSKEYINSIL